MPEETSFTFDLSMTFPRSTVEFFARENQWDGESDLAEFLKATVKPQFVEILAGPRKRRIAIDGEAWKAEQSAAVSSAIDAAVSVEVSEN